MPDIPMTPDQMQHLGELFLKWLSDTYIRPNKTEGKTTVGYEKSDIIKKLETERDLIYHRIIEEVGIIENQTAEMTKILKKIAFHRDRLSNLLDRLYTPGMGALG